MIEVSACVICDGQLRKLKPALVAPFIAWRIWNRDPGDEANLRGNIVKDRRWFLMDGGR